MIAIKPHIRSERVLIEGSNDINYVCTKISLQRENLFIYIGYIPPKDKDIAIYRKHVETIKKIDMNDNDNLFVLGDFNLPGLGR